MKITVFSYIFYSWDFKQVKLPWLDHNALQSAQNS